jgi:hypothetical protein
MAEFAINSTISSTTEFAPFELNYGWMPTITTELKETQYMGIREFAEKALWNLSAAHDAILTHRVFQTQQANKHRREDPPIKVGDLVYLSTEDLNLPKGRARKLQPKYIGPYPVTLVKPETSTYKLKLPPELAARGIFPKFHISRIKPHVPNDDERFPRREVKTFYDFGEDPEAEWQVDEIIGHKWERNKLLLHVKWNLGDTTWESLDDCQELAALDDYLVLHAVTDPYRLPKQSRRQEARESSNGKRRRR